MKIIFLVEDDEGIREMVSTILEMHNYKVFSFSNIRNTQAALKTEVPDLFLLDVMLPDGNGVTFCEEIKALDKTRGVPVILMSAHADLIKIRPADDFIAKPFDVDEMLRKLRLCLSEQNLA